MKKFLVIIVVMLVLVLFSFAEAQDCGKCPLKCKGVKKQTVKKEKPAEPMVFVSKTDKMYHKKDCAVVQKKEGYTPVVLSKALEAGARPCTLCKPAEKPAPKMKITAKKSKA